MLSTVFLCGSGREIWYEAPRNKRSP
jgi:hypothetical protein